MTRHRMAPGLAPPAFPLARAPYPRKHIHCTHANTEAGTPGRAQPAGTHTRQPHAHFGACWLARREKNSGSASTLAAAHFLFCSNKWAMLRLSCAAVGGKGRAGKARSWQLHAKPTFARPRRPHRPGGEQSRVGLEVRHKREGSGGARAEHDRGDDAEHGDAKQVVWATRCKNGVGLASGASLPPLRPPSHLRLRNCME